LNLPYFISRRISSAESKSFSATINKIAIASVGLGLAIMIISFLILGGFQRTIQDKIFSFGAHIQITKYSLNNSYQEDPIGIHPLLETLQQYEFVDHAQAYSHKAGLLRTENEIIGALLKGVDRNFESQQFIENMAEGHFISFPDSSSEYSTDVVISRKIANTLALGVGDEVIMDFVQDPVRSRKLNITGIYDTGLEEFDEKIIIGDLALIQRLNQWGDSLAGGVEVYIKDFNRIDEAYESLNDEVDYTLFVEKVSDKYIQMFEWLGLLQNNVVIFLVLILFVACFNMVSILLILIMERTQMIGVLKALGASNLQIRKIFSYNGFILILKGMILGNIIGIGFGLLQYYFQLIPLDPENYYMDFVPIEWNLLTIFGLNVLTFAIIALALNIPTTLILRIQPIRAIRFD
jgi:lipoprotein-releasing system permease protein